MNRQNVGRALILLGVSMWIPYFALRLSGAEVAVTSFLTLHLIGVIPGSLLLRGETIVKMVARWFHRDKDDQRAA